MSTSNEPTLTPSLEPTEDLGNEEEDEGAAGLQVVRKARIGGWKYGHIDESLDG